MTDETYERWRELNQPYFTPSGNETSIEERIKYIRDPPNIDYTEVSQFGYLTLRAEVIDYIKKLRRHEIKIVGTNESGVTQVIEKRKLNWYLEYQPGLRVILHTDYTSVEVVPKYPVTFNFFERSMSVVQTEVSKVRLGLA